MVNNATAAIIRQMIISLFEWVGEEEALNSGVQSESNGFELSHALDALLILSDVTCRLDDQKCEALDLSKVDKPFALDLIESVLVNHGNIIRSNPPLSSLIKNRICPYLIESLKQQCNSGDFAKTCRHWRIIQFLIGDFNDLFPDECEIFLIYATKILKESNLNWERAMVLEVLKIIFQSQNLIEEFYLICEKKESNPRIFKDMMEVMLDDVIIKVLNSQPSPADSQGQILEALGKSSVLTQFDKSAPPAVSPISLLLLAYDAFNCWFGNLETYLKSTCTGTENSSVYRPAKSVNLNPKSVSIITDLILFIGTPLSHVMKRIYIELAYNQRQLNSTTLEFFSRAMKIFSVFEFHSQLRELMSILLNFDSNLLVIQMILETSQGIGELLEDSLISVVKVIQQTEQLQSLKLRKQPANNTYESELLAKAVELANSFTELTAIWDDKSFTFLIQSYGQLIDEIISSNNDERIASALFLILNKLKRLSNLNMARFIESEKCSSSWELLMEDFLKTMRLKDVSIRQSSCEIVGMIVDLYIKSVPTTRMKSSKSQVEDSSCENYQMRILSPLSRMTANIPWIDVQKVLLDSLMKYLNVFGECFGETSWSLIWRILRGDLKLVQESGEEVEIVLALYQKIHETVKICTGDFLASIPISCFSEFIDLIAEIGKISLPGELNIPLNTVRYLWDISDYLCGSKSLQEVFTLWTGLLERLCKLSLDSRPELRNSAVQTLLRTVNMNGSSLKGHNDQWSCLFEEILFEFMKDLRSTAKASKNKPSENGTVTMIQLGFAHFSRDSETKQWDETESTVMTGLTTLIMTHFKGILIDLPPFLKYWQHFLQILQGYALMPDGSAELTGVAINCLLQLCTGLKEGSTAEESKVYSASLWQVWLEIGKESSTSCSESAMSIKCMFFTQDTLLKYFKIFFTLLGLCEAEPEWLEVSLCNLTASLQLPTPSDQVRDVESATEVQKFLVNRLLSELLTAGNGREIHVVLIVKEVAKWLKLTTNGPKSRVMIDGISMGYASIRSRQSTASTTRSDSGETETNSLIKYTFIAMTSILLDKLPSIVSSSVIPPEGLVPLIGALGRFMKLKYKCPMNNKMPPIWRTSTVVFISIMKEVCSGSDRGSSDLWRAVLNELKGSLHSAKEMFNSTLKIELIEADEKFDCQLIKLIVDVLIPFNAGEKENSAFADEAIDLIFGVARITKFSNEDGNEASSSSEDFLFPSGVKTLPIAVKEILSFQAYNSIFRLAGGKDERRVKEKLTSLLKRHLEAYLCDRQIFGNEFPFPRLRDLELFVLLRGMRHLLASEELKQVYDLIVKCADFGSSGGCEGVRIIVGECRKVLLLLDESRGKLMDLSEEETTDCDCEDIKGEEMESDSDSDSGSEATRFTVPDDSAQSIPKPQTPIPEVATISSTSSSPSQTSSRRSVSEELFDHLAHDLRIMQFSQDSQE